MKINQEMRTKNCSSSGIWLLEYIYWKFLYQVRFIKEDGNSSAIGMNCYSCPAARLACPIGAMQAVSGSMNFKLVFM